MVAHLSIASSARSMRRNVDTRVATRYRGSEVRIEGIGERLKERGRPSHRESLVYQHRFSVHVSEGGGLYTYFRHDADRCVTEGVSAIRRDLRACAQR